MRTLGLAFLWFVLGFLAGYVAAAVIGLIAIEAGGLFDRDGGIAMAIFFALGPLCGVVTGAIAVVWALARRRAGARAEA